MTEKTVKISITTEINGKAIKREIRAEAAGLDGEMIKMMVEMIRETIAGGLRKRYESVKAVDGVSFQVEAGEIFGIVGPNGSGATTTTECKKGLRQPDGD